MTETADDSREPFWARFISKEGLGVAVAVFLIYWLTQMFGSTVTGMRKDLSDHISDSSFYSHQLCVFMAKSSGEPVELCEQQKEHTR
jgi:hypothetical protein